MEERIVQKLGVERRGLSRIIPTIRKVIALVIDTAYDLQESECSVNLKLVPSSSDGLGSIVNIFHRL